jgi:hypothetical protein
VARVLRRAPRARRRRRLRRDRALVPRSLRELQGSEVLEDAIADQARVRAVHKGLTKRVFEAHTSLFPPRAATLAATEWAWSVVHSRASRVPTKGLVIVPLADMINDADETETEARAMLQESF